MRWIGVVVGMLLVLSAVAEEITSIEEQAWRYAEGRGVTIDQFKASELFRQAARNGSITAAVEIAKRYESGLGVRQSAETAFSWYEVAASDNPLAARRYGEIVLANQGSHGFEPRFDPIERLVFAAENGEAEAALILGLHAAGRGEALGGKKAEEWLVAAAEELPEAGRELGKLYAKEGNSELSRSTLARYAELDKEAAGILATYFEFGIGGNVDKRQAATLYKEAVTLDWARVGLERLIEQSRSVDIFGVKLYGATRQDIQHGFSKAGARIMGQRPHLDAFEVPGERNQGTVLTIGYQPGKRGFVAEATYRFGVKGRSEVRETLRDIEETLISLYGAPDERQKSRGDVKTVWKVGRTVIFLDAKTKDVALSLSYQFSPYANNLRAYLEENETSERKASDDLF